MNEGYEIAKFVTGAWFFIFTIGVVHYLDRIAKDIRALRTNPSPAAQQALHHDRGNQPAD